MNETDKNFAFPKGFLWGASTAAHQVEGENINDWTLWEQANAERLAREAPNKWSQTVPDWQRVKPEAVNPSNYISGGAADHYQRYSEDIQILNSLSLNAYRFSIEWSRVQPREGQWNPEAIEHYRNVLTELRQNNIEPFVTLWHRTNPVWIAKQGDWANKKTVDDYAKFVERMATEFGNLVKFWVPLNEPFLCATAAYIGGEYPPQKKNIFTGLTVIRHFVQAHIRAYNIIHEHSKDAQVGTADAAINAEGFQGTWLNNLLAKAIRYFANWKFLDFVKDQADFFGVQYYQTAFINVSLGGKYLIKINQPPTSGWKSDMGWSVYPEGLYNFLMLQHARYHKPIYITENGIADALDATRAKYISEHLTELHRAIADGVEVKGYFHWSLLDNLEWNKGFWPKFGLVEVDRLKNYERTIRASAFAYAKIAKSNSIQKL